MHDADIGAPGAPGDTLSHEPPSNQDRVLDTSPPPADAPARPSWEEEARRAGWNAPPPPEPEWMQQARASGWNPPQPPPGQPAGPITVGMPANTAGVGAPSGTPTGTTWPAGTPSSTMVPIGVPPNAQPGVSDEGQYSALPGDSLPLIAEKFGHPGEWRAIHKANFDEIADPGIVYPGQRLAIPPEWLQSEEEEPANAEPSTV